MVAIKQLGDNPLNVTDQRVLHELMTMTEFHHDNVNAFFGVCLEVPNACILMAYANRGSLQDILAHEEINLTWDFQVSLMMDIAKGMQAIHNGYPGIHIHYIFFDISIKVTF